MWYDSVIVVKSVTNTRVSRDIGVGYTLKSICTSCALAVISVVFAGDKNPIAVNASTVEKIASLLQHAVNYPLEATFVNRFLETSSCGVCSKSWVSIETIAINPLPSAAVKCRTSFSVSFRFASFLNEFYRRTKREFKFVC